MATSRIFGATTVCRIDCDPHDVYICRVCRWMTSRRRSENSESNGRSCADNTLGGEDFSDCFKDICTPTSDFEVIVLKTSSLLLRSTKYLVFHTMFLLAFVGGCFSGFFGDCFLVLFGQDGRLSGVIRRFRLFCRIRDRYSIFFR